MNEALISVLSTFSAGLLGSLTLFIKLYFKSKQQKKDIARDVKETQETIKYITKEIKSLKESFLIYSQNNGSDPKIKKIIKDKLTK